MSGGRGGHKTATTWRKTFRKLKTCTSASAVAIIDTAHKGKDTYHRSHQEHSRGMNSKQRGSSELPTPCAPSGIPAPNAYRTTSSNYSDAHHEGMLDSGHPYATSPAGPNSSDSPGGWPLQLFQVSATCYMSVVCASTRDLGHDFLITRCLRFNPGFVVVVMSIKSVHFLRSNCHCVPAM